MNLIQRILPCLLGTVFLWGGAVINASELKGKYVKPLINPRLFGEDLAMAGNERDEYATNLAAYAVKNLRDSKADQVSLDFTRQILGLALHMSPRNRKCLIVNVQLSRGLMPQPVAGDYDPEVFARLLLTRGQLLEKRPDVSNMMLARYLIELAAIIDPRNEDAVYAAELRRVDYGDISWKKLTDASSKP